MCDVNLSFADWHVMSCHLVVVVFPPTLLSAILEKIRSRLDGEKPEEDEIRTKEDGQDEVSPQ